ncbi:MAG: SDR family NAD(P)-dependent oxidoreductase [Bacteroidota bacterium]
MKISAVSLSKKIVVITGGSSGIGREFAKLSMECGASVVICSNDKERLADALSYLKTFGSDIDARACDIRNKEEVEGLARYCASRYGHVDILVNNAGFAVYRPFEESSLEESLDILDVNLSGSMRCAKAFLPGMIARRQGRIVNISSIGGELIITPNAAYCAAKHGIVAWSKAIRHELAQFNIAVNVVCPGYVKTHFHDHATFRRRDPYRKKGRLTPNLERVSKGILSAILRDRVVTYVPSWLGLVVWCFDTFPFVMNPLWKQVMKRRTAQLYYQIEEERKSELRP